MGTNYKRKAIHWKYPGLEHGEDADFYICNEGESEPWPEIFNWNTKKYPKPAEDDLKSWYEKYKYLEKRIYADIGEQLDRLWHDIDKGIPLKEGAFYLKNKAVKDSSPRS